VYHCFFFRCLRSVEKSWYFIVALLGSLGCVGGRTRAHHAAPVGVLKELRSPTSSSICSCVASTKPSSIFHLVISEDRQAHWHLFTLSLPQTCVFSRIYSSLLRLIVPAPPTHHLGVISAARDITSELGKRKISSYIRHSVGRTELGTTSTILK